MNITKAQADKVIAALEMNRIMAADADGNYTKEVTPKIILEALSIMRGLAEDAEQVALPGDLVIKALLAMDAEARKRGEMYPQTLDEQREDTKSVRNVIASLEFYTSEKQCNNGWPSVKDWPALPATSPQAAQTALQSESLAQAAQAPARLPSEGKPIEALAPTEAQEREDFEAHWYNFYHAGHISADVDGKYRSSDVQKSWNAWKARAGRKG